MGIIATFLITFFGLISIIVFFFVMGWPVFYFLIDKNYRWYEKFGNPWSGIIGFIHVIFVWSIGLTTFICVLDYIKPTKAKTEEFFNATSSSGNSR